MLTLFSIVECFVFDLVNDEPITDLDTIFGGNSELLVVCLQECCV
jgi:hypothetical protein